MNSSPRLSAVLLALTTLAPATVIAESGLYVGGSVGSATLVDSFDGLAIDAESTPYRFALGLQFSDYFSIEGGYQSFGTFEERLAIGGETVDIAFKADGITVGLTGGLPISDTFNLFGRAGAFFWNGDALIDSIRQPAEEDTNAYYGGGATVSVTDRLKLVGDWTRYELETTESDVISLGFTYRF